MRPRATRPTAPGRAAPRARRPARVHSHGHRGAAGEQRRPPTMRRQKPREIETKPGLRLRRGHPFQQVPARDVHADERPHDRVAHQPRLVRQHRDRQPDLRGGQDDVAADGAEWLRFEMSRPRGKHAAEHRQERPARRSSPGRTRSTPRATLPGTIHATTSVRNAAGADSVRRRLSSIFQRPISGMPRPEDPRQQLPVAARPAVLARRRHAVVRRARSRTARRR